MEEKKNNISLIGKILGKKNEPEFSAEKAWIESTYGSGSYKDIEVRIKEKQNYIKSSIENKYRQVYQNGYVSYSSYHCIIDIEEDLASFIDVIFKPFIEKNFKIINLSEKIEDIDEPNVYMISWKNAFKPKNTQKNTEIQLLEE